MDKILTSKENYIKIKEYIPEIPGSKKQERKKQQCNDSIPTFEKREKDIQECIRGIPNSEEQDRLIQEYILRIPPSAEQTRQIQECEHAIRTSPEQERQVKECEHANLSVEELRQETRELIPIEGNSNIRQKKKKIQTFQTCIAGILASDEETNSRVNISEVFSNYSFLNLTSVAQFRISEYVKRLNFSHNYLKAITKLNFRRCCSLEILDLSYNLINNIERGAFQDLLNLTFLDLSFNRKLQTFPELPPALKVLKIHGTSITSIQGQMLKDLTGLSLTDTALVNIGGTEKLKHLHIHIDSQDKPKFNGRGLYTSKSARNLIHPGHLNSLKISQEYTSDKLFSPKVLSTLSRLILLPVDNLHLEGVYHWMDIIRLLREIPCSSFSNITLSGVFRWFPNCNCDGCKLDYKLCSNVSDGHKNVSNQAISIRLREQPEDAYPDEGNIMNSLFLLHLSTVLTKYNHDLIRLSWGTKFIDMCSSVENSVLDLSSGKISNYSSWNQELPLPKCRSLDAVTDFKIFNNNLKIDLLSLMSIVNVMENISRMDASHNRIYLSEGNHNIICGFKSNKLLFLNISNNPFNTLDKLCVPSSLEVLDLSFTNISKIFKEVFKFLPNLETLYLRGNHFIFQLKEYMRNSSIVDLPKFFVHDLPHLQNMKLSDNDIPSLPCFSSPLSYLDINNNQLQSLPTSKLPSDFGENMTDYNMISVLSEDFEQLSELESLFLSFNKISYLQPGCLPPSLLTLDISHNAITTITEETFSHLIHLEFLNIEGNSFFCNCDLFWFANNFVNRPLLEVKGWDKILCSFPQQKRGQQVKDHGLSLLHCTPVLQVAIAMAGAVILTLLITGLCWHYDGPWYVKMGWYWCMAKRRVYEKRPENKQYDAFVSYSEEDADWVKACMVRQLESEGFQICYHERDFKPGHPILGNIFNCIENSHKVIFVLSTSFVTSCWCQYELYFAEHRILNANEDSLIMVVLEELPPHTVPLKFSKLRKLLNRKTYLKWSPEEHKQTIFWHQLTTVLKTTNKPIGYINPFSFRS
uniref:Toll-like receptor 1 n=1 Tax=Callorhinchus milii TaxID=7868 RepID=A0A4W3GVV6_CALMI